MYERVYITSFIFFFMLQYQKGVECYDSAAGPRCGRCPLGMIGDGKICKPGISCSDRPCYM